MRVVLVTYRGLKSLMPEYMERHEAFFNMPVTLAAEEDYSQGRYHFIKPPFGETIPNGEYGNSLRWALEQVRDRYVIIMMVDYFIQAPVDSYTLRIIARYMTMKGNILRCEIGTNRGVGGMTEVDVYRGVSIREEKIFLATSLCPGIWDRKKLLEIMKGATAWDVEIQTNREFQKTSWRSIGVYPEPMDYVNYIRGRDLSELKK